MSLNPTSKKSSNPKDIVDNNADVFSDEQNDLTISADQFVLPKNFDHTIDNTQLSAKESANVWSNLAKQWNCSNKDKFIEMKLAFTAFCCLNGTSDKLEGEVTIAGEKHDIADIFPIINAHRGATLRKFMSANAAFAHALLFKNPELAQKCAKRKNMGKNYQSYACDFMDNLPEIAPGDQVHLELMKAKNRGLKIIDDEYSHTRESVSDRVPKINIPGGGMSSGSRYA